MPINNEEKLKIRRVAYSFSIEKTVVANMATIHIVSTWSYVSGRTDGPHASSRSGGPGARALLKDRFCWSLLDHII
jgi:hypothetical protein